ncbi:MAG: NAD(P)-dependent alcohol dehydrogenase [Pseudomonadota bacterium]
MTKERSTIGSQSPPNRNLPTSAYAVFEAGGDMGPFAIERRPTGQRDVLIDIDFCGVCHTDYHYVMNSWGNAIYPVVPGHEIVGRVRAIGAAVTDLAVGQTVGVGCLVGSCGHCGACLDGEESYCTDGLVLTYNSPTIDPGGITYGGFSRRITVDRDFVLTLPATLDMAAAAPLLCAGITTYSPLRHWNIGPGMHIGIIGLGGLGHVAVKIARALGADVTVITTTDRKRQDAERLGAKHCLVSSDQAAMSAAAASLDFLLNTVPVPHCFDPYLPLLKRDGVMCLVGAFGQTPSFDTNNINMQRRTVTGSFIGGLRETQEMLDFCGAHGIVADIELIPMQDINLAFNRLITGQVGYRLVIDMSSLAE